MKKSVKVDLSWRAWSLIVGLFILIGFVGLSFAYGGTSPAIHGHSAGEIEGGVAGGSGSTTIVSSCMPDYSAGVSLSISVLNGSLEYRAPSDGWFMGTAGQGSSSKSNISINGNLIIDFQDLYGSGGGNTNWAGFSIPVNSGNQIKLSSKTGSSTWAKFYPCLNSGSGSVGSADYVTESWKSTDGSSWYRKYNSGWIEQGGFYSDYPSGVVTITFPKPFENPPLSVLSMDQYSGSAVQYTYAISGPPTKTTMQIRVSGNGWGSFGTYYGFYWEAKGY